jgi:hypothetical protein
MSEMCHLYSVSCHIVYIVKSYSKSFSFHHLSQKHTKKIEKIEKMLLRIHPPNQGYLKAHSLYSNHFFRLVCSIAITTQKKNHIIECTLPLHVIYLISHRRSKRRLRRTDCLVSVGANRLTDLHVYGVRFRPKDPAALNHLIISDHSV